jgi:hypothetical protein
MLKERTLDELKNIFFDLGIDFYISKVDGQLAEFRFMLKDDEE